MTTVLLSPKDSALAKQLEHAQVRAIAWPEPAVSASQDYSSLDEAIESLFGYDWIIFKSRTAVDSFLERFQSGHAIDELDQLRVLAIGSETAERITSSHLHLDIELETSAGAAVFDALAAYVGDHTSVARLNVLIPSAHVTRESFEQQLEDAGARIDNVAAYGTTVDGLTLTRLKALLAGGGIDAVLFRDVASLLDLARLMDTNDLKRIVKDAYSICGDAETMEIAGRFGLNEVTFANPWTVERILAAVAAV